MAPKSTTTNASPSTSKAASSKKIGTKVGLGVGIPVVIVALAALFFLLWRRLKNKKRFLASSVADHTEPTDIKPMDYMYNNNGDLGSPYTATSVSPEVDQRDSSRFSNMGNGAGIAEYRGVSTGGLGLHPVSLELPDSPSHSELSGSPTLHREPRSSQMSELRNSQISELAGSRNYPSELPERAYR